MFKPAALLTALVLPLCAVAFAQQAPSATPVASAATASRVPSNYQLSPNDLIEVKVFQEEDMDWTVRVSRDGGINLPVVGAINVARKTADDVAAVVKERLLGGYLIHPQVHVTVLEFAKRRFTILGQVQKAGQIDFPDNAGVTLLQAIGMAGGYTRNADPGRVYIKRQVGSKEVVLKLDAGRMARKESIAPFEILPGDTITVSETIF